MDGKEVEGSKLRVSFAKSHSKDQSTRKSGGDRDRDRERRVRIPRLTCAQRPAHVTTCVV
jgi:hypothetical protein